MIELLFAAALHYDPLLRPIPTRPNWICDGPKFDSSCRPSNGNNPNCHTTVFGRGPKPYRVYGETRFADKGRIAYCRMPAPY